MARRYAHDENDEADKTAGTGMVLAFVSWAVFAIVSVFIMEPFVKLCTSSPNVIKDAVTYGRIVSVGSIGVYMEGCFTKVHQASGNMKLPTIAQVAGALTNIVLDPIFIFGFGFIPQMGVAGAAIATVIGQIAAAVITGVRGVRRPPKFAKLGEYIKPIYYYGFPSIFMQMLYVVYIMLLNIILSGFSDAAVTVLGLYYKWQSFFFIPLFALQTCIVPVLSYNFSRQSYDRCRAIVRDSVIFSLVLMAFGIFSFEVIPQYLIGIFSKSKEVLEIGKIGFRIIGASFAPAVFSLISPTIFQAIGEAKQSLFLSLFRQLICLGADLLAVLICRLKLHMAVLPNLRNAYDGDRPLLVLPGFREKIPQKSCGGIMTRLLGKIRQAKRQSLKRQIAVTAGIIVLGLAVGVLQKRIDVLPGNAFPLWLQRL